MTVSSTRCAKHCKFHSWPQAYHSLLVMTVSWTRCAKHFKFHRWPQAYHSLLVMTVSWTKHFKFHRWPQVYHSLLLVLVMKVSWTKHFKFHRWPQVYHSLLVMTVSWTKHFKFHRWPQAYHSLLVMTVSWTGCAKHRKFHSWPQAYHSLCDTFPWVKWDTHLPLNVGEAAANNMCELGHFMLYIQSFCHSQNLVSDFLVSDLKIKPKGHFILTSSTCWTNKYNLIYMLDKHVLRSSLKKSHCKEWQK